MRNDNGHWFESFFFIAISFTFAFEILVDLISIIVCDIFLPNMIYPVVMYAKRMCEHHMEKLCSVNYPLDYYDSFSSSRYLHASHFYADCIELSIEKVFVMSFVNPFPGRMSWSRNEATFSSPMGWVLISLCSMLPHSVLKMLVNVISSVIVVLVFLSLISNGANYFVYFLVIAILLLPFLFSFYKKPLKIGPENNTNDILMTMQPKVLLLANDKYEKVSSAFTMHTLDEDPVHLEDDTVQYTEGGMLMIETDDTILQPQHQEDDRLSDKLESPFLCNLEDDESKIGSISSQAPSPTFRIDIPNIISEDLADHKG